MASDPNPVLGLASFRARLAARALEDPEFRRELTADPRAVLERELSLIAGAPVRLPPEVRVHVHQENASDVHIVLPEAILADGQDHDMLIFWERILSPDS